MFDELNEQLNQEGEVNTETPTLRTAAEQVFDGLIHFTTKKGKLRSRPISWAKKIAREHFGWSRIGSKKFESILEIGFQERWFEKTDDNKLIAIPRSTVSERGNQQTNNSDIAAEMGSSKSKYLDMAPFYRQGGALGNWKVLTEDDWDGRTYKIITPHICSWIEKPIEVPSWKYGQVVYELYDQKVREDLANGAERTYCTSCKSEMPAGCVYPDSHGRIACSACNDLLHPDLRRGADWTPPSYDPAEINGIKGLPDPEPEIQKTESDSFPEISPEKHTITKLGESIRQDGVADLMDAEKAITSAS